MARPPASSTPGEHGDRTPRGGFYNGTPAYVLTATRHPPARSKTAGARPEETRGGDERGTDASLTLEGGDGGRLSPASGSAAELGGRGRQSPPGGDDAVWEALRSAFHPSGRQRHAGVRDVLEAVRGLGFEARAIADGGGSTDANAMQASQVCHDGGVVEG